MNESFESKPLSDLNASSPHPQRRITSLAADWISRFFSSNPFYLASAAVLLWGINRLSVEPKLAGAESAQILFNFSALFAYEILLVVTAIFLARRAIWYDSLLLVGLENLFVLIPFSLVSRAVLIDQPLARELCLAATLFAFGKFWSLKRYIPNLNLPGRLLGFGVAVLAFNIAIAVLLQRLANDRPSLHGWLNVAWLIGIPALTSLAAWLPIARPTGNSLPGRAWLPFAMLGLWLTVTGFHLFGVGYVHDFNWKRALLAPALLTLAWTVLLRTESSALALRPPWRRILLYGPLAAPFLALADTNLFFALTTFNALAYAALWWKQRTDKVALVLCGLALAVAAAGLPDPWLAQFAIGRTEWVLGVGALCVIAPIVFTHDPRLGLLGAGGCALLAGLVATHFGGSWHWAAQAGFVFVLVHSLRWRDAEQAGAGAGRVLLGLLWVLFSFAWTRADDPHALAGCGIAGSLALASYAVHWLLTRRWQPRLVAICAALVISLAPGLEIATFLRDIPPGFMAVLGSLALFVAGTIAALTRPRWQRNEPAKPL